MRAHFIRGQNPKHSMEIGVERVYKFLENLSKDYQLDPNDERYLGYINVYEDGFMDVDEKEGFRIFVETWPRFEKVMHDFGLDLNHEPDIEETMFLPLTYTPKKTL